MGINPQKIEFLPPVIAHRGAPLAAPENTLEAFAAARDAGARWLETDVKLTADGVPVLIHDDTLDRTTTGHGDVANTPWSAMQSLDAGRWFSKDFAGAHVPSLVELLKFSAEAKMRPILELKPSPGRTQATVMVALIEAAKLWPDDLPAPVISSFDMDALMIAAQLHPDWPRALLLDEWREDWHKIMGVTQSSIISVNGDLLTPQRLAALRDFDMPVVAYTVNDPTRANELLNNGVAAVYSDNVAALVNR